MTASMRISTIIATHNRAPLLVEALDSLAAQQRRPWEVLVVDDGSGPETRRALEHWQARQGEGGLALRYFYQSNRGPAVARNRGVAESRGDLIHFMDDDDLLEPDALQHLATALEGAPSAAASLASYAHLHTGAEALAMGGPAVAPSRARPAQSLADMIAGHWFVPVHGYLFTRAAVMRMGEWDASFSSQEDDEYFFRAVLRGVELLPAPQALVYYRQHGGVRRATPGKPGETVLQGLRKRLRDDLAIRDRVFRDLCARGVHERLRAAFVAWYRRLQERYEPLLAEVEEAEWAVLSWLAQARPPAPRARLGAATPAGELEALRRAR